VNLQFPDSINNCAVITCIPHKYEKDSAGGVIAVVHVLAGEVCCVTRVCRVSHTWVHSGPYTGGPRSEV